MTLKSFVREESVTLTERNNN